MTRLAIEFGICAAVILAAVVVSRYYIGKSERAEHEAAMAEQDAQDANKALQSALSEKRLLEAMLTKYDEAFLAADRQTREAIKDNVKRQETIRTADDGWLDDALPDGVRDAFADFVCSPDAAAGESVGTVRTSGNDTP